jgi:hypothetical protein
VTEAFGRFAARPEWTPWARWLVAVRHPILLALAFLSTYIQRGDADWTLLSAGGQRLFSAAPWTVYAHTSGLQAGPLTLVVVRGMNILPGGWGLWATHVLLAILGWYLLFLAERWTSPDVGLRRAPLKTGLLTLAVGIPVMVEWGWVAGDSPHLEDPLAILLFLLAVRAITKGNETRAAVLIGLALAFKPWAIAALPLVLGCQRKIKAIAIAIAVPAACWLPFVLGDHATLSAAGHGFRWLDNAPLHLLGLASGPLPDWWRSAELLGVLAAAALAARQDWRIAFAAGCTMRLLLDPAAFPYYYAGLLMATALTERLIGARPWRTAVLFVGVGVLPAVSDSKAAYLLQAVTLAVVYVSWLQPLRGRATANPFRRRLTFTGRDAGAPA